MQQEKIYKHRLKVTKLNELKFISHLDWQNLILKIFRRCELSLVLSQGFNKMPKVSYSPALPIFIESECELINFQTLGQLNNNFIELFKKYSPNGLKIIKLKENIEDVNQSKSLENYCQWALYTADLKENINKDIYNCEKISYIIEKCLSSDEFLISKKTKKGINKLINYRNSIHSLELREDGSLAFVLKVGQNEHIPALRADEFLYNLIKDECVFRIKRLKFFDTEFNEI